MTRPAAILALLVASVAAGYIARGEVEPQTYRVVYQIKADCGPVVTKRAPKVRLA